MHSLIREVQKSQLKKVPQIKTGYTVVVHQKIKEGGKERVQLFEGLVIKVGHGEGVEKTFTVRKVVQGIGVEKIFPINSPNIAKVVVRKKAKVRRSKLYYMRERFGKSARLQERHVTDQERAEEEARMEAMIQEAVKADEKKQAEEVVMETAQEDNAVNEAETADSSVEAEAPVENAGNEGESKSEEATEESNAADTSDQEEKKEKSE